MKNITLEKISKALFIGAIFYFIGVILMIGIVRLEENKAQYAKEHNCRWDYNDMCYTVEQRPWLFND